MKICLRFHLKFSQFFRCGFYAKVICYSSSRDRKRKCQNLTIFQNFFYEGSGEIAFSLPLSSSKYLWPTPLPPINSADRKTKYTYSFSDKQVFFSEFCTKKKLKNKTTFKLFKPKFSKKKKTILGTSIYLKRRAYINDFTLLYRKLSVFILILSIKVTYWFCITVKE